MTQATNLYIEERLTAVFDKLRQEGRIEGEKKGEVNILTKQLKKRFGSIPKWAREKLKEAEAQKLELWSLNLLDAQTVEETLEYEVGENDMSAADKLVISFIINWRPK